MDVQIEDSWKMILKEEFEKPYFQNLVAFLKTEHQKYTIYPPGPLIFNAFKKCSFPKVKVVIIGQDPYHGPGQANGLCFSVSQGIKPPPSLKNIFININHDLKKPIAKTGNLERWSDQGVLLLNAILTVRKHQAASHHGKGWENFTDAVIEHLNKQKKNLIFLLWGKYAQQKGKIIDKRKHLVLQSAHPSPLSARFGFFDNKHFSQTNAYLLKLNQSPIDW